MSYFWRYLANSLAEFPPPPPLSRRLCLQRSLYLKSLITKNEFVDFLFISHWIRVFHKSANIKVSYQSDITMRRVATKNRNTQDCQTNEPVNTQEQPAGHNKQDQHIPNLDYVPLLSWLFVSIQSWPCLESRWLPECVPDDSLIDVRRILRRFLDELLMMHCLGTPYIYIYIYIYINIFIYIPPPSLCQEQNEKVLV